MMKMAAIKEKKILFSLFMIYFQDFSGCVTGINFGWLILTHRENWKTQNQLYLCIEYLV